MRTRSTTTLTVHGIPIEVTRKPIKHVYVKVTRDTGAVRVSAPHRIAERDVREAVEAKLSWIRAKRDAARARPSPEALRFVPGETHWVWGRPTALVPIACAGRTRVDLVEPGRLELHAAPTATLQDRRDALDRWYRAELEAAIPRLIARWEPAVGRSVAEWRVRSMKTRWGSCNPVARRIWLGTELAKRSPACLEYVVVHEMAHLVEANHGPRFYALMDRLMSDWRERRSRLNAPLVAAGGVVDDAGRTP